MNNLQDLLIAESPAPVIADSQTRSEQTNKHTTVIFNGTLTAELAAMANRLQHLDGCLIVEQTEYADAKILEKAKYTVTQAWNEPFDHALFIGSRIKDENIIMYLRVLQLLSPGGSFFTILPNTTAVRTSEQLCLDLKIKMPNFWGAIF